MSDLHETLKRLARRFVAGDVMVPRERLKTAADESEGRGLLDQYPRYDVIPIRHGDRLVAFVERGSKVRTIQLQHLVSADTPILDVVESLSTRWHVFVVGRHEVVGLIQFSDLNDPIVKLPYFVLLEGLERQVADSIRGFVTEDRLPDILDPQRLDGVTSKMTKLQQADADRDWVTLLSFREILEAALRFGMLALQISDIEDLSVVRNRVAHAATDELVECHADVGRLARVRRLCVQLLFGQEAA